MEDFNHILLALVFGAIIGFEREWRDKAAGLRTLICISVGSAMFTLLSYKIGGAEDATRITSNIVTGVGFLGAGVLLKEGSRITGLTTASLVWLTAAVGMACGSNNINLAIAITFLTVVVMWFLPILEHWIDGYSESRNYILKLKSFTETDLIEFYRDLKIYYNYSIISKSEEDITIKVFSGGSRKQHDLLILRFIQSDLLKEFSY